MKLAPVVLFVHNRPAHTRRTVESLLKDELASESDLVIYSDAAKNPDTADAVGAVREYVATITGFRSVSVVQRDKNWGLARSVIDGVTSVVNEQGRIIVLEDDLIVSRHFLEYMNTALDRYQDDDQVMQISGHMFPVKFTAGTDAVFLPMTTSWGWATWRRAWRHFDPDATGHEIIRRDPALCRRFNLDGSYDYARMLEQQLRGEIDSWAVRWNLSVFLRNGITLFPKSTLVENAGFDGSGTHGQASQQAVLEPPAFEVNSYPGVVAVSEVARKAVYLHLARRNNGNAMRRCLRWIMDKFANFYSEARRLNFLN